MLTTAFFFTQCGEDEETCEEDEICTVSVSVCCDDNDVCTYTYDGEEYSESEIVDALESQCTSVVIDGHFDVAAQLQNMRLKALGL